MEGHMRQQLIHPS